VLGSLLARVELCRTRVASLTMVRFGSAIPFPSHYGAVVFFCLIFASCFCGRLESGTLPPRCAGGTYCFLFLLYLERLSQLSWSSYDAPSAGQQSESKNSSVKPPPGGPSTGWMPHGKQDIRSRMVVEKPQAWGPPVMIAGLCATKCACPYPRSS